MEFVATVVNHEVYGRGSDTPTQNRQELRVIAVLHQSQELA